jgi:hypothetical protein
MRPTSPDAETHRQITPGHPPRSLSSYSGGDRLCSFEATAARIHVIQSAISQHIKTLEQRAGQLQ